MSASTREPADEGGEAPCFAHLHEALDLGLGSRALGQVVHDLADAVVVADRDGTVVCTGMSERFAAGMRSSAGSSNRSET